MDPKPKINFIERNRLNIGQRKLSGKPTTTTSTISTTTKSTTSNTSNTSSTRSSSSQSTRPAGRAAIPSDPAGHRKKEYLRPAASKDQEVEKSAVRKSQNKVRPPTSTVARRTKTSNVRTPKEEETDLVTKMTRMNLLEQLLRIFLPLDSETLTACREVCKSWNRFFRFIFWREIRVRNEMLRRLEENWRNKRYYKVGPIPGVK